MAGEGEKCYENDRIKIRNLKNTIKIFKEIEDGHDRKANE